MSIAKELDVLGDYRSNEYEETWDELRRRITVLNEWAWEHRVSWKAVEEWLHNFDGRSGMTVQCEQIHALYLLAQFLYFGSVEIRVLLKAMYRDLFLIPLIQEIREQESWTRDLRTIRQKVDEALMLTRFFGVGNPSESGVHLLYYFRQENGLSKHNFMDTAELFERSPTTGTAFLRRLRYPQLKRYIFVDDVCGSGDTAVDYSKNLLEEVLTGNPKAKLSYHCMFATADGLAKVREKSLFQADAVAVFELDETYKCLSTNSRYLKEVPAAIDPNNVRRVARHYGSLGFPGHAEGYEGTAMLLGFHHNTPDNTLPIIWMEQANGSRIPWLPIFRRYPKI